MPCISHATQWTEHALQTQVWVFTAIAQPISKFTLHLCRDHRSVVVKPRLTEHSHCIVQPNKHEKNYNHRAEEPHLLQEIVIIAHGSSACKSAISVASKRLF